MILSLCVAGAVLGAGFEVCVPCLLACLLACVRACVRALTRALICAHPGQFTSRTKHGGANAAPCLAEEGCGASGTALRGLNAVLGCSLGFCATCIFY